MLSIASAFQQGVITDVGGETAGNEAGEVVTRVRHETKVWSKTSSWVLLATIGVEPTMNSTADSQFRGLVALHAQLHLLLGPVALRSPQ